MTMYSEKYRPRFHFTPKANWMNDPNGLVFNKKTGEYHMFYQYCQTLQESQADKFWGHAVSRDLVHWTEEAPAIGPDSLGGIWSGSAVIDRNNTSGFFPKEVDPEDRMVAFFTYAGGDMTYGFQKQGIAYSLDSGKSWIKYEGNPVIKGFENGAVLYENRDPKVIWYPDDREPGGGVWLMMLAGMRARLFVSRNLRDWVLSSEPNQKDGVTPLESECPDFFPIAVDGDSETIKWVYCGGGRFYLVGDLLRTGPDRFEFLPETDVIEPMNGSQDMYAAQTFSNEPLGRRIAIYWLIEKNAEQLADSGKLWDGAQSIPLEYRLRSTKNGYRLSVSPVSELVCLREEKPLFQLENCWISQGENPIPASVRGVLLDVELTVTLDSAREFGLVLRQNDTQRTVLSYQKEEQLLCLDKNRSGQLVSGVNTMHLKPETDGKIALRVLTDTSVIDVCGNQGEAMIDAFVYPEPSADGISFFVQEGRVFLQSLTITRLRSIWEGGNE